MTRPGAVVKLLVEGTDDAGCRWLCQTAGRRTRDEELGLAMAMRDLAGWVKRDEEVRPVDMLRRVS